MVYVLVHNDESTNDWTLHKESDGTEIGGPYDDPRGVDKSEMYADAESDGGLAQMQSGNWYIIRESSDTPLPW